MDYSKKNETQFEKNNSLLRTGFDRLYLPTNQENRGSFFDVDLHNLKRAYNVSIEFQESLIQHKVAEPKTENDEEEEENGCLDGHDPIEFCESQLIEEENSPVENAGNDHEYKCFHCNFVGNLDYLKKHTKYCHHSETVKYNWCVLCHLNFENESVFKQHQKLEHPFYDLQCINNLRIQKLLEVQRPLNLVKLSSPSVVNKNSDPAQQQLKRYIESDKQNQPEKAKVNNEKFKCIICQKYFGKKESLVKHTRIHTRDSYKCSLCEFTCNKKVTLKMHCISHEGNRKYKCAQCDYSFKQIGHLKRHKARFNH